MAGIDKRWGKNEINNAKKYQNQNARVSILGKIATLGIIVRLIALVVFSFTHDWPRKDLSDKLYDENMREATVWFCP